MAETKEKLVELFKILGFVAKPFTDGFLDGFNDAVEEERAGESL